MTRPVAAATRGFSLVELLVTLVVLALVMVGVTTATVVMQRGYVQQREVARAEEALRNAESTIVTLMRTAGANPYSITGPQLDPDPLNTGTFNNLRVVSDFNPADGDVADPVEDVLLWVAADTLFVRWQFGLTPAPVAYPVRSLAFEYRAADGSLLSTKAAVANAAKVAVTITAPRHSRTTALARRTTWIQLRNR